MLAVDGGVTQIGTMDVVAVNRGAREGMKEGYVLAIYQTFGTIDTTRTATLKS